MTHKKLKILMWADTFLPDIGGLEVIGNELALQYVKLGHEVKLVTTTSGNNDSVEFINGFEIFRFSENKMKKILLAADFKTLKKINLEMNELIDSFKPDVIHCHTTLWVHCLFFSLIFKSLINVPLVITVHLVLEKGELENRLSMVKELFATAKAINCVSHANKKLLQQKYPFIAEKLLVVHNGLPANSLPLRILPSKPAKILFVGRLVEQKGVDVLLKAFNLVLQDYQEVTLTIAGDGIDRQGLEILAAELKLSGHVQFRGWVEPSNILALINESTLVVMPSRHEGFSIVALQAAQMGRPLIASRLESFMELIIDQETGVLATCDDPNSFADAIKKMLANPEFANLMGEKSKAQFEKLFTIDQMSQKYLDIFYRIIQYEKLTTTID